MGNIFGRRNDRSSSEGSDDTDTLVSRFWIPDGEFFMVATRIQNRSSSERFREKLHGAIVVLNGVLGLFVGVKYHSKGTTPFHDHPSIMVAAVVIMGLYSGVSIAEYAPMIEEPYLSITKKSGPLLGFLVNVLLLIILVPWFGMMAAIIWGLFVVGALFNMSFPEILEALLYALTPLKSSWSWICNRMRRLRQMAHQSPLN